MDGEQKKTNETKKNRVWINGDGAATNAQRGQGAKMFCKQLAGPRYPGSVKVDLTDGGRGKEAAEEAAWLRQP